MTSRNRKELLAKLLAQGDPQTTEALDIFNKTSTIYKASLAAMGKSEQEQNFITQSAASGKFYFLESEIKENAE